MQDAGQVWRVPLAGRVFAALFAALCLTGVALPWEDGFTTIPPDGSGNYTDDLQYRALALILAALAIAMAFRARLELRRDELISRSLLRTQSIPLESIVGVTPTEAGLRIETRDGRSYGSPSFIGEKSRLSTMLGRRTRSDEIADAIMKAR
jgi:hypothetical protein